MSSIKIKSNQAPDLMEFKNFTAAMNKVRSARPGDLLVNGMDPSQMPKSPKFKASLATRSRMKNFGRTSMLYGVNGKTPYSTNIIKSQAEGWEMLVGDVEEINEEFKRRREYRHSLEIVVALSSRLRIRSFGIDMFPPGSKLVDPDSFRDSRRHLEEMSRKAAHLGHPICTMRGRLAERGNAQEIRNLLPRIPYAEVLTRRHEQLLDESYSLEGFIRKIKDLCDGTHDDPESVLYSRFGIPGPKTLIRLSLDSAKGIVFNRESLDTPSGEEIVIAWLHDIIEVTSGDKRMLVFDPRIKTYRRIRQTDTAPPEGGLERVLQAARDNMDYIHPAMRQT